MIIVANSDGRIFNRIRGNNLDQFPTGFFEPNFAFEIEDTIDNLFEYYVDTVEEDFKLMLRPTIQCPPLTNVAANDTDLFTISNLPRPCIVSIDGIPYEIDDGKFEFTTSMPGVYVIEIDHFPYLPFRAEVTAT